MIVVAEALVVKAYRMCRTESIAPAAALARCLAGNPRLILLDEPTEGIQPSIIDEIAETLLGLRSKGGLTMILVEQNLDFIATLSERVLIIQKGVIVHSAEPSELHGHGLVNEFIGVSD